MSEENRLKFGAPIFNPLQLEILELEGRIRELEAELALWRKYGKKGYVEHLESLINEGTTLIASLSARAEKAEARVAELEGVYEAEACPTCGVTQVALWETHQSIHKAREREVE